MSKYNLFYPIIHHSELHLGDDSYKEYSPKLEIVPAKKDYMEPELQGAGCIPWLIVFGVCLVIGSASGDGPILGIFFMLAIFVLPIAFGIKNSKIGKKNSLIKKESVKAHNEFVELRNKRVLSNNTKKELFTRIYDDDDRVNALKVIYNDISFQISDESNYKVGASEVNFINQLQESQLSEFLKHNLYIHTDEGGYYPDIAIIDHENYIFIDIEIDEPYTLKELIPIHYIGVDVVRNKYFNSIGWTVVRFSEKQIVRQPKEVISLIEQLYYSILEGTQFKNKEILSLDDRWTEEKSILLSTEKYRNSYLY
jgi:hypothetical protein